jgi:RNA polymerase sigma factor (sigma-70 family)
MPTRADAMSAQELPPPSPEDEPLTSDERTRAADLFQHHAEALARRLAARFPGTDPEAFDDAVVWTVMRVSCRFERYDPAGGSLPAYLFGFARRRLAAILRSDQARRRREQKKAIDPVTAATPCGQSPLDELADRELAEQVRASLRLRPEDQCLLDLWLRGEHDPHAWAAALGKADRPPEEQAKAIEQAQARLRQCLHRARHRLRQQGDSA